MLEHPRDLVPIINAFCQDRDILYQLLDDRFAEIDIQDGKTYFNYKWIGTVIKISAGIVGENQGFMFIESILN